MQRSGVPQGTCRWWWVAALLAGLLLLPARAHAWGVGMHARAADRVVEALRDDPAWSAVLTPSDAADVVRYGAAFPTWVRTLPRMHFPMDEERADAVRLARHLLERAEASEQQVRRLERRLFALGLLVQARGNEARSLLLAVGLASAPLGPLHLREAAPTTAEAALRGDATWLLQGWVDLLVTGPALHVDVFYESALVSERANQRAEGLALWYCEEASAYFGREPECLEAVLDFRRWMQDTEAALGGLSQALARDAARGWAGEDSRALFAGWLESPLRRLVAEPPADLQVGPRHRSRLLEAGWGDIAFWEPRLSSLLPVVTSWVVDSLEREPQGALVSSARAEAYGAQASLMAFLPDAYAPSASLLVDRLQWRDRDGNRIEELPRSLAGEELLLELRWLPMQAIDSTITVRVRLDRPGWDATVDTVIHEVERPFLGDPAAWVRDPASASIVVVTLPEDLDEVEGLYVELLLGDAALPALTTRGDRFWRIEPLDVSSPAYQLALRSYGRFPGSLPLLDPVVRQRVGELFVRTRGLQGGPPLEGVEVLVAAEGGQQVLRQGTSGAGGVVAFEGLPPGRYNVVGRSLHPQRIRGEVQLQADVNAFSRTFVTLPLERVPEVEAPGPWQPGPRCARFAWNSDDFGSSVDAIRVGVVDGDGVPVIPMQRMDSALVQVCRGLEEDPLPEETPLRVQLATVYDNSASAGLVAASAPFQVDAKVPRFDDLVVDYDEVRCRDAEDTAAVEAWIAAGPSGLVDVGWRSPRESGGLRTLEGIAVERAGESWRARVEVPEALRDGRPWVLVARSGAGVLGASRTELAFPPADPGRCGPAPGDDVGEPADATPDDVRGDADADAGDDVSHDPLDPTDTSSPEGERSSRSGSSCALAAGTPAPWGPLALGLLLLGLRAGRSYPKRR